MDHLTDVVVDGLVSFVGLELFCEGFVEVYCSFVVAKDEEVICNLSGFCFLCAVGSLNSRAAFEKVDESVLGSVDFLVSSAELSESDLDVLLDLYSLIVDNSPQGSLLIITD